MQTRPNIADETISDELSEDREPAPPPAATPRTHPVVDRCRRLARRNRQHFAALTGYLAAAYAVTYRLWSDPGRMRIAGNAHDISLYQWWLGWPLHALTTAQDPMNTFAMNAPTGVST